MAHFWLLEQGTYLVCSNEHCVSLKGSFRFWIQYLCSVMESCNIGVSESSMSSHPLAGAELEQQLHKTECFIAGIREEVLEWLLGNSGCLVKDGLSIVRADLMDVFALQVLHESNE